MICPKCGRETAGNFCSNCGASLLETEYLDLDEDLDIKDLFPDEEDFSRDKSILQEEASPQRETLPRERDYAGELHYAREKQEQTAPLRAPRSRKNTDKEKSSHKKEKVKKVVETKETGKERKEKKKTYDTRENRITRENRESRESRAKGRSRRNPEEEPHRRGAMEAVEETGESVGKAAVKGAIGVLVLSSRVMQIICFLLMGAMVGRMSGVFLRSGDGLGALESMITDRNYGLALYVGAAGITVAMGAIWCLWILSKKSGGGEVRLKKYDVGRGFIPFLICLAVIYLSGPALMLIPEGMDDYRGLADGAAAFLNAVSTHRNFLEPCALAGEALSLIRKLLRV